MNVGQSLLNFEAWSVAMSFRCGLLLGGHFSQTISLYPITEKMLLRALDFKDLPYVESILSGITLGPRDVIDGIIGGIAHIDPWYLMRSKVFGLSHSI